MTETTFFVLQVPLSVFVMMTADHVCCNLCLSWNAFISLPVLKASFTGFSILDGSYLLLGFKKYISMLLWLLVCLLRNLMLFCCSCLCECSGSFLRAFYISLMLLYRLSIVTIMGSCLFEIPNVYCIWISIYFHGLVEFFAIVSLIKLAMLVSLPMCAHMYMHKYTLWGCSCMMVHMVGYVYVCMNMHMWRPQVPPTHISFKTGSLTRLELANSWLAKAPGITVFLLQLTA